MLSDQNKQKNKGRLSFSADPKYRMHDPRVGRFFTIDPLTSQYPHNSPYAFSENRVIDSVELEGLEKVSVAKNNPYLIILVLGRANGRNGDGTSPGKTLYKNLPQDLQNDDGLALLNNIGNATIIKYSGSDGIETQEDILLTIEEYRKNNPDGKIALVGHSIGGKDVMGVAQSVEVSEKIKNKTIDLLITLEAANTNGLIGDNQEDNLGSNVKQVINFNSNNSSYKGEGGTIEDKKNMLNINLKKGTTHTNMDNTILPGLISVLKALGDGKNALNLGVVGSSH